MPDNRCDDNNNVLYVSDRCYWTITSYTTFTKAHELCQAEDGLLAEIPNQEAQTKIQWVKVLRKYFISF